MQQLMVFRNEPQLTIECFNFFNAMILGVIAVGAATESDFAISDA
jgi:hypothetical protein